MDPERWDKILSTIGAPRSSWVLMPRGISKAKKAFTSVSGAGADWSQVLELKNTWRSTKPLIDADGRPFALFIYDQAGNNYRHNWGRYGVRSGMPREYKFHVSWCKALEDMAEGGRRARYKAKYDVDNDLFSVHRGGASDERIRMKVCRFCLGQMAFMGYSHTDGQQKKDAAYEAFDIGPFFTQHTQTLMPRPTHQYHTGRYPRDWAQIAARIRQQRGNRCEGEGPHGGELHVHHVNGVKDDVRPSNLLVLCRDCHARQPMHGHMLALPRR